SEISTLSLHDALPILGVIRAANEQQTAGGDDEEWERIEQPARAAKWQMAPSRLNRAAARRAHARGCRGDCRRTAEGMKAPRCPRSEEHTSELQSLRHL